MNHDPLEPYRELARKHGIDPSDHDALVRFVRRELQEHSEEERELAFRDILAGTTNLHELLDAPPGGEGDWFAALNEVVRRAIDLAPWDHSITRYLREEIREKFPQIQQYEVNANIALDSIFSSTTFDNKDEGVRRALYIVPWARDYQSRAVVLAFTRFFWHSLAELPRRLASNSQLEVAILAQALLENTRFLEPILQEFARSAPRSRERRLYDEMLDALRRVAVAHPDSSLAFVELAALERGAASRARYLGELLRGDSWVANASALEVRMGFDNFYDAVRLASMSLSSGEDNELPMELAIELIAWLEHFIDRQTVQSRDSDRPELEHTGPPIRTSWIRLQELYLTHRVVDEVLADEALAGTL